METNFRMLGMLTTIKMSFAPKWTERGQLERIFVHASVHMFVSIYLFFVKD